MSAPRVSVIVPCYNAAPWLAQTLESALAQEGATVEVIVVDDGSRDDSLAIARRFEARGVRVVAQQNQGAGPARNAGLRLARGDYIQFLDADDLLAPGKLDAQLRRLAGQPGCVATGTWIRFFDDPRRAPYRRQPVFRDLTPDEYLHLCGRGSATVHSASWLVPRAVAEAAGPWNAEIARSPNDDAEYFTRVVLNCRQVLFCPDAITFHRTVMVNSLSKQRGEVALTARYRTVELITSHLLQRDSAARTRRLCADHFQRVAYIAYPAVPDIVERAQQRARELGGSDVAPSLGRVGLAVARLVGWKPVARLRHWLWTASPYPTLKRRVLAWRERRRSPAMTLEQGTLH